MKEFFLIVFCIIGLFLGVAGVDSDIVVFYAAILAGYAFVLIILNLKKNV